MVALFLGSMHSLFVALLSSETHPKGSGRCNPRNSARFNSVGVHCLRQSVQRLPRGITVLFQEEKTATTQRAELPALTAGRLNGLEP